MLRPEALRRLAAPEHRFCPTPGCPVVYFGTEESFHRDDVVVPVFQKEPAGARTVCYCFAITETDIRREVEKTGHSTAATEIAGHVKADRCACELRNPQGSCCLGNIAKVTAETMAVLDPFGTTTERWVGGHGALAGRAAGPSRKAGTDEPFRPGSGRR
jgi:hypothetical protein